MSSPEAASRGVLVRYRVMAFVTATLLIILVFAGIPLQIWAHRTGVVNVVGTMHGFLYIVYLVTAFSLTRRLGIPKWQMLLVLLAGTVPFCAFVAERKLTHRFEAAYGAAPGASGVPAARPSRRERVTAWRRRWLSPRAFLLHAEILVVAPGCFAAGWWQATRALGGNGLSWVYSIEWPIFGLLAIYGWWHLVHEDPEDFRARRFRSRHETADSVDPQHPSAAGAAAEPLSVYEPVVGLLSARLAVVLAVAVSLETVVGFVEVALVPFGRPSRWVPAHAAAIWGIHASLGLVVGLGAIAFIVWSHSQGRIERISAWTGGVCLAVAAGGGLMTEPHTLVRFLGVAVMGVGALLAVGAYVIPIALRSRRREAAVPSGEPVSA